MKIFLGLLVQTLGSLWFFEFTNGTDTGEETQSNFSYKVHQLNLSALFWSLKFDPVSRLLLASTKPQAHARHIVRKFRYFHWHVLILLFQKGL